VSRITPQPLFYPSWEVLPNDVRLPHSDVISERLEMLVTLTQHATHDYLATEEYPSW
jgi:transcription-repair coupling factor (superfamily II helicase)